MPRPKLELPTIHLRRLDVVIENALKNEKYVILFDKSGNASVYFTYKATMREFHKEMVAVTM